MWRWVVAVVVCLCAIQVSDSAPPARKVPEATGKTKFELERRTIADYRGSAYSFRYRSQSAVQHKNYVDLLYSANGHFRINNHAGLKNRIADLGKNVKTLFDFSKVKPTGWKDAQIEPLVGHYYALQVRSGNNEMPIVFRVDHLNAAGVGITAWYQKGKEHWPVSIDRVGAAGVSGLSR